MRHKWAGVLAATAGVGLLIAGCGSSGSSTGSTAAATSGSKTIRLIEGGGFDFSDAAIYEAMDLLKQRGYDVSLENVADPTTALRAVLAGKADVYLGDPVEAPKYTLQSLAGATMATAGPGTAGVIVGVAALQKEGIDVGAIHQVTVGGTSARVTAILSGQVGLAPVHATDAATAAATGKVKILLNAGAALGVYLQQGLIASDSFVANTATAQATVNAFIDAQRWAYANEAGYAKLVTENKLDSGLTATEAQTSWGALKADNFWASNGALCASSIDTTLGYDYKSPGGLTKATTPSISDWVDTSFVNTYLKAHGQPAGAC
jgi:ABC-type nitrate/sulfonate/bicarbonate transport system substrate-binding protein